MTAFKFLLLAISLSGAALAQSGEPQLSVLESRGRQLLSVQDGNAVQLRLQLAQVAAA